ncbi:hypothetical protein C0Q44_28505 [Paenibacillus sp. PCH8]|uniref:hypothetical protein n=1 Tax=Paenibacillus sp. PCH8 TaxID=2066524 RepID=UPI000CFA0AE1|nr:hypothetical protein [Paenibacillus sp. PCH8]PQP80355.1 hypothetical protein C0Q44_28505 [Paenibacillus sp. PCH8]
MDPVIGILLPLPRVLFSKLSASEDIVEDDEDKDFSEPDFDEVVDVTQETDQDTKNDKLAKIKEKAAAQKGIMQQTENIEITREEHFLEENEKPLVVRNTFWDSPAEEPVQIKEKQKELEQILPQTKVRFAPASIDETTLRLAERIRQTAEDKRSNKGSSESE